MPLCTRRLLSIILFLVLVFPACVHAGPAMQRSDGTDSDSSRRWNVFIFSREKHTTMAGLSIRTNAWFAHLFHRRLKTIRISSPEEMVEKVKRLMDSHPGSRIGNLWIDSHGSFRAGYSLFLLGYDTVDHRRADSPRIREALTSLARYCDDHSYVTIGSCYGAADYVRPANRYLPDMPMNGDSLMLSVSHAFPRTPVLAAESWVMTKPFMFGNKWGLNGYPLARHFRDTIFRPVWERLGQWRMLQPGNTTPLPVHTVSLTGSGDIRFNDRNYLDRDSARRKQRKHLSNLEPDLYGDTHPK